MVRAARFTTDPLMSVSLTSISPAWIPARIRTPKESRLDRRASAASIAADGVSNVASTPSPVDLMISPFNSEITISVVRSCASSFDVQPSSPTASDAEVDPTMSVNKTAAYLLRIGDSSALSVTNPMWWSYTSRQYDANSMMWSSPGISMSDAPEISSAHAMPCPM